MGEDKGVLELNKILVYVFSFKYVGGGGWAGDM